MAYNKQITELIINIPVIIHKAKQKLSKRNEGFNRYIKV